MTEHETIAHVVRMDRMNELADKLYWDSNLMVADWLEILYEYGRLRAACGPDACVKHDIGNSCEQ